MLLPARYDERNMRTAHRGDGVDQMALDFN
jgi:hypothetical protein